MSRAGWQDRPAQTIPRIVKNRMRISRAVFFRLYRAAARQRTLRTHANPHKRLIIAPKSGDQDANAARMG
jgi:hypothetical protein